MKYCDKKILTLQWLQNLNKNEHWCELYNFTYGDNLISSAAGYSHFSAATSCLGTCASPFANGDHPFTFQDTAML